MRPKLNEIETLNGDRCQVRERRPAADREGGGSERGLPSESSTQGRRPPKGRGACERPAEGGGVSESVSAPTGGTERTAGRVWHAVDRGPQARVWRALS